MQGWKGRFSAQDRDSWDDPDLCKEVGYDATSASHYDDGVFHMSWDDVLLYFRNIHMSWSSASDLFRYRTAVHGFWGKDMGPIDDSYNIGENPQYTILLSDKALQSKATVWLLLSRHVTKQEQEGGEVRAYVKYLYSSRDVNSGAYCHLSSCHYLCRCLISSRCTYIGLRSQNSVCGILTLTAF